MARPMGSRDNCMITLAPAGARPSPLMRSRRWFGETGVSGVNGGPSKSLVNAALSPEVGRLHRTVVHPRSTLTRVNDGTSVHHHRGHVKTTDASDQDECCGTVTGVTPRLLEKPKTTARSPERNKDAE